MLPKTTMKLRLGCYFPAEEPCFISIQIEPEAYVEDLSEAIYEELKLHEQDVRLNALRLYKTDVATKPRGDLANRARQWLHEQPEMSYLDPTEELEAVFPTALPRGTLHILVADPGVVEILDTLGDPDAGHTRRIKKALDKRIKDLADGPSPSETVQNAKYVATFLDGEKRHACLDRVPAALFSPPLAKLQQRLDDLAMVEVFQVDIAKASTFHADSIRFFDDESQRQSHIKPQVDRLVGEAGIWQQSLGWADNIKPDASWWHEDFLTVVLELKNTLGLGGDPVLRGIVDFSKIISRDKYAAFRGTCNFPVVILGVTGNRLQVSVAVCVGSIYATNLLTFDLSSGFHSAGVILRLARVFKAVSLCRADLKAYYANVATSRYSGVPSLYPSPTSASGVPLPSLTYSRFMTRGGEPTSVLPDLGDTTTTMYLATLGETDPKDVVVKFTARYSKEAHELLADAGLAPKLYFCELVVGNLYMVVMELVKGKSIWHLCKEGSPIAAIVPKKVEEALSLLHEAGIVFGDLRDSNILYVQPSDGSPEGSVFLIDFDWPGKDGEGRYPATLNTDNAWDPNVMPYAHMQKAHDLWQLDRLKALCRPDA